MTPSTPIIIKMGLATIYNVLESFRLAAEEACRYQGERPFAEILFSSKRIIKVLDGEVKNDFRNIFLHLSQEATGYTANMKKDR